MKTVGVSSEDLRFYLIYFNLIDRSQSNTFNIGLSPGEGFLEPSGVLTSANLVLAGSYDIPTAILEAHQKTFQMKQEIKNEFWSLGRSGASFVTPPSSEKDVELLEMSLFDALPSPNPDVPLAEILEFKERRRPELPSLRAHPVGIYESVSKAGDIPRAESAALTRFNFSIVDLQSVVKPSFGFRLLSGMKVHIDPINMAVLAGTGAAAASGIGVPIALGAALGAACSVIKFEYACGEKLNGLPDSMRDFEYLAA